MKKLTLRIVFAAFAALAFAPSADAAFVSTALVKVSPPGVTSSARLFTYKSTDALATIEAANYFQSASLAAGDGIYVKGSDGKVILSVTAATATTSSTAVMAASSPVWVYCRQTAANLGTAGIVARCPAVIAGTVTKFYTLSTTVVDGDNIVNLDVGGTNMTGSATIAVAAAAVGDVDTATVTANNTVTAGQTINVETDGGGTAGVIDTFIQITP